MLTSPESRRMSPKRYAQVRIANDDGTDLVSVTSSNPADIVSIFPIVRHGTARDVLADF